MSLYKQCLRTLLANHEKYDYNLQLLNNNILTDIAKEAISPKSVCGQEIYMRSVLDIDKFAVLLYNYREYYSSFINITVEDYEYDWLRYTSDIQIILNNIYKRDESYYDENIKFDIDFIHLDSIKYNMNDYLTDEFLNLYIDECIDEYRCDKLYYLYETTFDWQFIEEAEEFGAFSKRIIMKK